MKNLRRPVLFALPIAVVAIGFAGVITARTPADSPPVVGATAFVPVSRSEPPPSPAPRRSDELRVHFLNVGAGTCTVVECPGANTPAPLIVDCGSLQATNKDLDEDEAKAYIEDVVGTRKPHLVLSHADRDHYGWIPTVLSDIEVRSIWQGGDPADYRDEGFPQWIAGQKTAGAKVHNEFTPGFHNNRKPIGSDLSCGDASTFVLTVNSGESKNANSLVLKLLYKTFSVILTGDAEGSTEQQARDNFGGDVKTTVLSGSHHGARTQGSNGAPWATATSPEVVVFSAGRKFGHPQCTAVNRFVDELAPATRHPTQCGDGASYKPVKNLQKAVYMTELNGRVVITSGGRSPLSLFCSGSAGCGVKIPH